MTVKMIVCRSEDDFNACGHVIPAGHVRRNCRQCGEAVWVAPGAQKLLETPNAEIYCNPCGLAIANAAFDDGRLDRVDVSPHATEHLDRMLGRKAKP